MMVYKLQDIERSRGDFGLRIENCDLMQGEVYAVVGPNGCGKSTFLDLLGLIERPSRGGIIFCGVRIDHDDSRALLAQRRRIGYLMQNPYMFNMSVADNIGYGLRVRKVSAPEIKRRAGAMMERLSLSHLASRNAHDLSGGEVQRVALARTLVLSADVFLLDEPTANVDQGNIRASEELIADINRESKATVILTTHSVDQAYRVSRNCISIIDGRISDIGYENVFKGLLAMAADSVRVVTLDNDFKVMVGTGRPGDVTIAVDPRDIILSRARIESSALNESLGTITRVDEANGSFRVFVDVGIVLCALVTRRSYVELELNIGKEVWLTFKANAVKVL